MEGGFAMKRFFLLIFLCVNLSAGSHLRAATISFEVGFSPEYQVLPNSFVEIVGVIKNTGNTEIKFFCNRSLYIFRGCDPAGSAPSGSVARGNGDWSILDNFSNFSFGPVPGLPDSFTNQFNTVILPGETSDFIFGTFRAASSGTALDRIGFSINSGEVSTILRIAVGNVEDISAVSYFPSPPNVPQTFEDLKFIPEPGTSPLIVIGILALIMAYAFQGKFIFYKQSVCDIKCAGDRFRDKLSAVVRRYNCRNCKLNEHGVSLR